VSECCLTPQMALRADTYLQYDLETVLAEWLMTLLRSNIVQVQMTKGADVYVMSTFFFKVLMF
jgi:hypothetical protein